MGIKLEEEDAEIWINSIFDNCLPAITKDQMRKETEEDHELATILKEKRSNTKLTESSKGPYRKIWDKIWEVDGILMRLTRMIVP